MRFLDIIHCQDEKGKTYELDAQICCASERKMLHNITTVVVRWNFECCLIVDCQSKLSSNKLVL